MKLTTKQIKEVEGLIINGATIAYKENLFFTGFQSNLQSRIIESLITINVAKSLLNWCISNDLQINLEYPISDFYNGGFPAFKLIGEDVYNRKMVHRKNHTPQSKKLGRLDIVITKTPINEGEFYKPSLMSLIGIEIKSINKSTKKIQEDIVRIANSILVKDDIADNVISNGYCLFFRRLDNPKEVIGQKDVEKKKETELKYWAKVLENKFPETVEISYEVQEIIIENSPIEIIGKYYDPVHYDYSEVAENSGLVVCYLIKLKRKYNE